MKEAEDGDLRVLEARCLDEAPKRGSVTCPAREFDQLPISKLTQQGLQNGGFTRMTEIQRTSIPHALAGRDLQGGARTGSGKTLSFLVPLLEKLYRNRWSKLDGLGGLVISPTRELVRRTQYICAVMSAMCVLTSSGLQALQIFEVLRVVGREHIFSAGLIIGGKDVRGEQERICGMNVLVATPGRLLQHMDETPGFDCGSLLMLVLDEADRILDLGFAKTLNAIVQSLPKKRQTLLFSATLPKSVKSLARLSLDRDAEIIGARDEHIVPLRKQGGADASANAAETSGVEMPSKLMHCYLTCELPEKLNILYSFVKTHLKQKTLVFLSSCKQTKFFYEALRRARPGLTVTCMHGRMKQMKRMAAYCKFCDSASGCVMLATDIAARGLDITAIDWVVQLDCPEDVATYVHRSGRTARYDSSGRSLLFLLPSETEPMLSKMTEAKIEPKKVSMNAKRTFNLQESLAGWVAADPDLKYLAQKAFVTFVRSYYLQKDKEVFDISALPLAEYAIALGLPGAPRIRLVRKDAGKSKTHGDSAQSSTDMPDSSGFSANADYDDDDMPATQKKEYKDGVTKLITRKNVGVLDPSRAALRAIDDASDDEDLMQLKRRDHDIDDHDSKSVADAAADKQADIKKMSRKQRREAKKLERQGGQPNEPSKLSAMQPGDSAITGWEVKAAEYASNVRGQLDGQDTVDKQRNKERVREKHRRTRQAKRQADMQDRRPAGSSDEDVEHTLPSIEDLSNSEDDGSAEESSSDMDDVGDDSNNSIGPGPLRPPKRARGPDKGTAIPTGEELLLTASQMLQSRSFI